LSAAVQKKLKKLQNLFQDTIIIIPNLENIAKYTDPCIALSKIFPD
jgi:hypothetical protein